MKFRKLTITTIIIIAVARCTLPYDVESFDYDRAIVVDALITDEDTLHYVRLSFTDTVGGSNSEKLSNADVWVEVGDGTIQEYEETETGTYLSRESFAGVSGETYQLFFTTPEGANYASSQMTLIDSPPIDSIYDRYDELTVDDLDEIKPGIQFFLDTHDDSGDAKYFRYEWFADYEVRVPFPSFYEYFLEEDSVAQRDEMVSPCYSTDESSSFILGNTAGSVGNRLIEQPINFVPNSQDHLRNRYALEVTQYALDEATYGYYRNLKESNESTGSLFDQQQGTIAGNIVSLDQPTETVLGFFEVAGVSRQRTFFSFSDLDDRFIRPEFRYYCDYSRLIDSSRDSLSIYFSEIVGIQIVDVYTTEANEDRYQIYSSGCTDCSWYAPTEPPEYWEY